MKFGPVMMILATVLSSHRANAGWNSGGGELIKDSNNPWFIQNTKNITYCVGVDEANFHVKLDHAEEIIADAFSYWKKEFAYSRSENDGFEFKVATQQFVKEDCSDSTDIRFQLGFLTPEQTTKLSDIREFISRAIRTDYDRVHLKGKGFIYIAPEAGTLRPTSTELADTPWQMANGKILLQVLIHELGHVFGIPHMGDQKNVFSLMSADFPDFITEKNTAKFVTDTPPPSFFGTYNNGVLIDQCYEYNGGMPAKTRDLFNVSNKFKCLKVTAQNATLQQPGHFEVYAREDKSSDFIKLGAAQLTLGKYWWEQVLRLWLPPEQVIFPNHTGSRDLNGAVRYGYEYRGTYQSEDNRTKREVLVTLSNNIWLQRIGGILNGTLILTTY